MVKAKAVIAIVLAALLVVNIALFAFGVIGVGIFWAVIAVAALITYIMFPKKRK